MLKRGFSTISTVFFLFALSAGKVAANPGTGAELHQTNCLSCHGTEAYTRANRRVGSFSSLVTQVNACNVNLGMGWFDDEVESVARYLNDNYYQF